MTKERVKELNSLVDEIDDLEKFIPLFQKGHFGNGVIAYSIIDEDIFFRIRKK